MKRTTQQNKALRLYARQLARALDESGYDMREVKVRIRPTADNIFENLIRPVMEHLYPEIESSTQLTTVQVGELYEVLNRATAEKLHVSVPFPSEQERMNETLHDPRNGGT